MLLFSREIVVGVKFGSTFGAQNKIKTIALGLTKNLQNLSKQFLFWIFYILENQIDI